LSSTSNWKQTNKKGCSGSTDYHKYRNITNFSALPGVIRNNNGESKNTGKFGFWWTISVFSENHPSSFGIYKQNQ